MALPGHVCPYGVKARHLLRRHGFQVEDQLLRTREEVDDFKARAGVATTPQVVIGGRRIGGHDDLRRFLGLKVADPKAISYRPVLAVFATAGLLALAISWIAFGAIDPVRTVEWFVGLAMCLLAMLKLQDVERFSSMFLGYDLLAARWVPYAYAYPFLELGAGVLMVAGVLHWLSIPVALFIGGIGAVSVFKAVYLDRRELKCACVGGNSNVPLGFVSLTENLFMLGMALWMLARL
jgi:glutaredoxin